MTLYLLTSIVMAGLIAVGLMNVYNVVATAIIAFVLIFCTMTYFSTIGTGDNLLFGLGIVLTKNTAMLFFIPVAFTVPIFAFLGLSVVGAFISAPYFYVKKWIYYLRAVKKPTY